MFLKIINGIVVFLLGVALIKFRKPIKGWTGNFMWAENILGRGGTYLIIIFFGMFVMLLGIMWPFGGIEALLP